MEDVSCCGDFGGDVFAIEDAVVEYQLPCIVSFRIRPMSKSSTDNEFCKLSFIHSRRLLIQECTYNMLLRLKN